MLINEITRRAVQEAIANPLELDRNKFDAQVARRILDRLVGYQISPLLWNKVRRGLSAGRVQSVAVRLVCEREKEIRAFEPAGVLVSHCVVRGALATVIQGPPGSVAREKIDNKKFRLENEPSVQEIVKSLDGASWIIGEVEKKNGAAIRPLHLSPASCNRRRRAS